MKFLLCSIFFLTGSALMAQSAEREKLQQLEQQREMEKARKVRMVLDSAIYLQEQEDYEAADIKFRFALANMKSIPSDLAYFFGKNSFYLGKYKQSVDWLTKYIQLKGTAGQYSAEAAEWLKKAESSLLAERQTESIKTQQILSRDYTIDCGPTGKVTCPVCNGSTVIIKKDYFGEKYKTCQYCKKLGYLSCEDYNKLLRGQLRPAQ